MGDHISTLESQYARLAANETSLEDSSEVAVLMATLQDTPVFESLVASVHAKGKKSITWSQVSTLFAEEEKRLNSKHKTNISYTIAESEWLAQASHKMNCSNNVKMNNLPWQMICYYCNTKGHMANDFYALNCGHDKSFSRRSGIPNNNISRLFNRKTKSSDLRMLSAITDADNAANSWASEHVVRDILYLMNTAQRDPITVELASWTSFTAAIRWKFQLHTGLIE